MICQFPADYRTPVYSPPALFDDLHPESVKRASAIFLEASRVAEESPDTVSTDVHSAADPPAGPSSPSQPHLEPSISRHPNRGDSPISAAATFVPLECVPEQFEEESHRPASRPFQQTCFVTATASSTSSRTSMPAVVVLNALSQHEREVTSQVHIAEQRQAGISSAILVQHVPSLQEIAIWSEPMPLCVFYLNVVTRHFPISWLLRDVSDDAEHLVRAWLMRRMTEGCMPWPSESCKSCRELGLP